jgi:hypothetical protein
MNISKKIQPKHTNSHRYIFFKMHVAVKYGMSLGPSQRILKNGMRHRKTGNLWLLTSKYIEITKNIFCATL